MLFMRPQASAAWFLCLVLPCISSSVCGQSQAAEKVAERDTTANPVLHVGGDVTAPKAIYTPDPEFSEAARKAGFQGSCVLSLIVGGDGRPRDIRVVRKLGMQLDEKAIQALSEWKFQPAQKGGKPVAVRIEVEVSFRLGQSDEMQEARSRIQSQIYRTSGGEEPLVCPTSSSDRQGQAVTVAELIFQRDLRIPSVDLDRIAVSIKQGIYSGSEDEIASEVSERVQRAWQNLGYFTAHADTDIRLLTSGPISERVAATVQVSEGQQYRLEGIRFKNNRAIGNVKVLRDLFPVKDGDILTNDAIEGGMRDLHRVYAEYGFINFSSIPTTRIHEEQKTVSLDIDLDEGKQFYVSRIDVVGLDEAAFENLAQDMILKPGDAYSQHLMEAFLERHASHSSAYSSSEPRYQLHKDQTAGMVAITYDFRHCSAN